MSSVPRELGRLLTAMLTPFREDLSLDLEGAAKLARFLVQNGSDGVVVSGTTGESPALADDEKIALVAAVREAIPDHVVVAGTGSNDTRHSVELSRRAVEAGADAILAVVPYYNKPPQEGLHQHFRAIAQGARAPVVMYNIQARTAVNMTAETTLRCAGIPGVVGVKEASGNIDQMSAVCAGAPAGFRVWSGDDSYTLPLMAVGGHGVICVVSHIAGPAMRRLVDAAAAGDIGTARELHWRLLPVIRALMTAASNPVPVKSVMNALGMSVGPFRLPLTPLPKADLEAVLEIVRAAGDAVSLPARLAAAAG